jgi:RHS repeat-associated protein
LIASYYYDPFGKRLWKDVGGAKTYFLYSDEGLAGEYSSSGTEIKTYGYKPSSTWTTDPLFMKKDGAYYFYQNDHLGTPQKMIGVNGVVVWSAAYESFGEATIDGSSTTTNNLRFPGQYYDEETGMHYNYHRYYDPQLGRYLKIDKYGIGKGFYHIYDYAKGNPIIYLDPLGLICTYLTSIPAGIDYNTKTKWDEWGEWGYDNMMTQGGAGWQPFLTVQCGCKRRRSGNKITTITLKWLNLFLCVEDCRFYLKQTYSFDQWENLKTVRDVETKGITLGWRGNESSAERDCMKACRNLNI